MHGYFLFRAGKKVEWDLIFLVLDSCNVFSYLKRQIIVYNK